MTAFPDRLWRSRPPALAVAAAALLLASSSSPAGLTAGEAPPPAQPVPAVPAVPDLPAGLSDARARTRAASRPATPDLVAAVWECPRCRTPALAQRLMPEQPPLDRMADLPALLERVALGRGGVWQEARPAEACAACGTRRPSAAAPREVLFFRYLPETGGDAVARMPVRDGRLAAPVWSRLDVSGDCDPVGPVENQAAFAAAFGRALSVREAWSDLVRESIRTGEARALRAGPGYYLTCRRRSDDAGEEARLAADLAIRVARLSGDGGRPALRWMDLTAAGPDIEKLVPTYRRWLPGQSAQLESRKYLAAAAVDPEALWSLIGRETARSGVTLVRQPGAPPDLAAGECRASLAGEAILERTVWSGLAFGEGLHHFAWPLAARLAKVGRVAGQARTALSRYETRVVRGSILEVREQPGQGAADGSGRLLARLGLSALAGSVDPRFPQATASALHELVGLDPASGEIRPPSLADVGPGRSWLAKKLRPKPYFEDLGIPVVSEEWRGLAAAWTLDTAGAFRYLPPAGAPDRKELEARFEQDLDRVQFHVLAAKGLTVEGHAARVAVGPELSGALVHPRLRRGLAESLKVSRQGVELVFWSPATNVVIVSPRPVPGRPREDLRRFAMEMARTLQQLPGHEIELEIREKLTERPAGIFTGG